MLRATPGLLVQEWPGILPFYSDQQDLGSHTKVVEPLSAGSLSNCMEQSLPLT